MSEKQKCCELVREEGQWGGFHRHQCPRNATVERDGKGYCKQHDPVERKAKSDASYAKMKKKWKNEKDEADKENRKRKAYPLLVKALQAITKYSCCCDVLGDCPFCADKIATAIEALTIAGEKKEGQLG